MRKEITDNLTSLLHANLIKIGVFGCPEVTINKERVDFLTLNKNDKAWRCYEIKSSKEDFYSNAKWTFVGHYNYFVMSESLFNEVKEDIPSHVGVTNGHWSLKKAGRQDLKVNHDYLMWCLLRSLQNQYNKVYSLSNKREREKECLLDILSNNNIEIYRLDELIFEKYKERKI